jgi:hypothetical protein
MKTNLIAICFLLLVAEALIGCERTIRNGPIIAGYRSATCILVQFGPGITPPTRAWDFTMTTRKGSIVRILGAAWPEGGLRVRYIPEGKEIVAEYEGDHVYVEDVRLDSGSDTLFIKADGTNDATNKRETWVIEYDLNRRQQISRNLVDPAVLPEECQTK